MTQKTRIKLLIVTQYFWPENFRVNDLAAYFSEDGHDVTVITGKPNYPQGYLFPEFKLNPANFNKYKGIDIIRVPMTTRDQGKIKLAINYLTFFLSASVIGFWKIRHKSYDAIFVFGVSPITVAIPAIFIKKIRKTPIFLWVLDLWPDSVSAAGGVNSKTILNLLGGVVSWIYNNCDHILVQSRSFFGSIQKYCKDAEKSGKVIYFPSWAEALFEDNQNWQQDLIIRDNKKFTIMFAGNIGEAQDFPAILNAAEMLKSNSKIRWLIIGEGSAYDWLKSEVLKRNLSDCFVLAGAHPVEAMPSFYTCADVMLVTLKKNDIFSMTIPGKLQSYLAFGKPVVGMIGGEAKSVIEESKAGMACNAGDSAGLVRILEIMMQLNPLKLKEMGESGRKYYVTNFERNMLLNKLKQLILDKIYD